MSEDRYSRTQYRALIAWEQRIRREAPLFERLLDQAPERSVLDVGCGTGEHVAWFARAGARAVGIDSSESMIAQARDHEGRGQGRFLLADGRLAPEVLAGEPPFGLAICLGNMLPHLLERADLEELLGGLRDVLLPGGLVLLQILNYRRILAGDIRHLSLNLRPGEAQGEEVVFLRLIKQISERRILFFPTTLVLDSSRDEPVAVRSTRRIELRPWTREDLVPLFERCGFSAAAYGDMRGGPYEELESSDLVIIARSAGPGDQA